MDDMVEFNAVPAPRAHTWPASVKESESSSGEEGSGGSERSEKKGGPLFKGELDKLLMGKRGVGYRKLTASEKKTQAQWEALYWEQKEELSALNPRFKVKDVVYWFHKPLGVWKWSKAIVEKVILPTELQYREGWADILSQVMLCPMGDKNYASSIGKKKDMRRSIWGDPTAYACMPSNTDALHSLEVVGIDTCSALSVSTREEDFLFLDRSSQATSSIVLSWRK